MSENEYRCAICGEKIDSDSVWKFLDDHIQFYFFDTPEENRFCSMKCAAKALMLEEVIL